MSFDLQHFLSQLNNIGTGQGFLRTIPIPLGSTTNNSVTVALSSGILAATMDNSGDTIAANITLPMDYDSSARGATTAQVDGRAYPGDHLALLVDCIATTTTTNTLEIDDIRYWRPTIGTQTGGTAVVDPTLSSAQSASQTISASTFARYTFPLHGLSLKPGDNVTVTLGCTIAANNILVRGLSWEYRSNLVYTTEALRR